MSRSLLRLMASSAIRSALRPTAQRLVHRPEVRGHPGSDSGSNAQHRRRASNIHVYRCHFDKCGIALWLHGTRCRIIGNYFTDCRQAIHLMWYGLSEDCYIEDNIIERCSGHDVELQTHGTIDERKILARNIYSAATNQPARPRARSR